MQKWKKQGGNGLASKAEENFALEKIQTFDLSYFLGKNDFEDDGTQNYLVFKVFQTTCK